MKFLAITSFPIITFAEELLITVPLLNSVTPKIVASLPIFTLVIFLVI